MIQCNQTLLIRNLCALKHRPDYESSGLKESMLCIGDTAAFSRNFEESGLENPG